MKKTVVVMAALSILVLSVSVASAHDYRHVDRYRVSRAYDVPLMMKFVFGYGQPYYMERRYIRYDRPWYPRNRHFRKEIRHLKREIRFLRREIRHDRDEWRYDKYWKHRRHRHDRW